MKTKIKVLILITGLLFGASPSFAQSSAPAVAIDASSSSSSSSQNVVLSPPVAPSGPTVPVATSAAPPAWLQDFLSTISALPMIGPYVSKILVWAQALGGILTALVAFLLAVSATLKSIFNFTGLNGVVNWIENFQQSSIMYWITSLSNIPTHITPAAAATPPPVEKKLS